MTQHEIPFEKILGYRVTTLLRSELRDTLTTWISEVGPARIFACANPHSLHVAQADRAFHTALCQADLLTPDGVGIVMASKLLGGTIRNRITGYDVFEDTCTILNEVGGSIFFLGSTQHVLDQIEKRLSRDWPNLKLAGTYSPPFSPTFTDQENAAMIAAVNAARPDVLWVGMTAPKQEKWVMQNAKQLDVRLIGAIGAVFDFYAETVPRSSRIFQVIGLEWLPRLIRQPRRLWRRNFVSNPAFMYRILRTRLNKQLLH